MCGKIQDQANATEQDSAAVASEIGGSGTKPNPSSLAPINLDHGDPTAYETYWSKVGERSTITFTGDQSLSYFANAKNLCWFLEPKLEEEIRRLHHVVGNAKVDDHFIIVGNGSSQLIQAALYAVSPSDQPQPTSVVSAAPYYSAYQEVADLLRSGLYKWGGDAYSFNKDEPYIEMVTSPNNPCGMTREPVVNRPQGKIIHDLAYYWPHYTPITSQVDYDIMLFTVSKCTGHAGSRIGWALVRDKDVARKMVDLMVISTIGVSKESQLRAAKILGVISDSCLLDKSPGLENFFEYAQHLMAARWEKLREIAKVNELFSLTEYPSEYCLFTKEFTEARPAFAWMSCKSDMEDLEKILRGHKILARGGKRFGSDPKYVRISMLSRDQEFNLFLERLSSIHGITSGN
ncbi:L-tryptophan--pyruvate aminotransferase 1-like [Coffea arabica]|uniref:L-tryptophan--pyruvate aminotransferase 1-like n=1 Tax=Coffea arabica TaxID=13443 RepID=A0ABM4W917_COFAR